VALDLWLERELGLESDQMSGVGPGVGPGVGVGVGCRVGVDDGDTLGLLDGEVVLTEACVGIGDEVSAKRPPEDSSVVLLPSEWLLPLEANVAPTAAAAMPITTSRIPPAKIARFFVHLNGFFNSSVIIATLNKLGTIQRECLIGEGRERDANDRFDVN
jgi:hypothetical protein